MYLIFSNFRIIHSYSEISLNLHSEAIVLCNFQHPLGVQKEPHFVMVKATELNQ